MEEERIMEMIKKGIMDQGYSIENDVKTDNSRHIEFFGNGKVYILNLLKVVNERYDFEAFKLTEEQRKGAWNYIHDMQSGMNEISAGEQLMELFKSQDLTLGQKIYVAYIFGRIEDRYREYLMVVSDTAKMFEDRAYL